MKKGMILITIGVLGAIFICMVDLILKKPVNDITGPKSISGLMFSVLLIIAGIRILMKKPKA